MAVLRRLKEDIQCLATMWFGSITGDSHKERLQSFYSSQAKAYDNFRADFLHGREQMLAECVSRLQGRTGMVWVDLGGGTAENVKMLSKYLDLSAFQKIYVVDLCSALCNVARAKVNQFGWNNVEVVEADACEFRPPNPATLITFSYSLSMMPPFLRVLDHALSYLEKETGIVGVVDFWTAAKYDRSDRQHSWLQRWFWRAVFDLDGIDLGPERRQYLDHRLQAIYECDSFGKIPYVPFLRAPYYIWIGVSVPEGQGRAELID